MANRNYYIGGFTWNNTSQLDRFVKDGIWENGWGNDDHNKPFKNIKTGDLFALKSTFVKGKKPNITSWLKISKVGIVSKIVSDSKIEVKWTGTKPFELTDITWYADTLVQITNDDHINRIFGEIINDIIQTEMTKDIQEKVDLLEKSKNLILTGAPGVGKTYKTAEIAVVVCDGTDKLPNNRKDLMNRYKKLIESEQIAFTTFHQSLDYEEFVEGLKPQITDDEQVTYKVKAGIFKKICERATEKEVSNFDEQYENFIEEYLQTPFPFETPIQKKPFDVKVSKNKNCVAIPKTEKATEMTISREMLQNYIEKGEIKDWKPYTTAIGNYIKEKYKIKTEISDNSNKNFILIIDEINRGNISKIFGELITLLEKDKRLGEENGITVTLPYSQEKFGVPSNLYIIGTMNTADRSIGQIDYALRRRFAFVSLKSDKSVLENYDKYEGDTKNKALVLFDNIQTFIFEYINEDLDAEDLMIGHSYFLCEKEDNLKQRLEYEIIPLIKEYEKDGIIMADKQTINDKIKEWKAL